MSGDRSQHIDWLSLLGGASSSGLSTLGSVVPAQPNHGLATGMWTAPVASLPVTLPAASTPTWPFVTRRFDQLIENVGISQEESGGGVKKLGRLIASLNRCYYPGELSETAHSRLIGSWAKQTRVRPFSDIDVMFILPYDVYLRFESRTGNKQSQLLQELRANLQGSTYPRTEIVGDRHVVVVEMDGVTIEVAPAILLTDGRYWVCDTKDGGRYKLADPAAELQALEAANATFNNNARQLTRLLKKWQIQNDVPVKAFQLERLAIEFLTTWQNRHRDRFWYDWMMRDFFAYMIGRANGFVVMPGTGEWVSLGDFWLGAAQTAYLNASVACSHEQANLNQAAGRAWQKIFGNFAPESV